MENNRIEIYTPEEVATILKVTRKTVYDWIKNNELDARKIGRRWYITPKALYDKLKPEN